MSDLIPVPGSLLRLPDRRHRRVRAELERNASLIEYAAERKMQLAAGLGHSAKAHITAAVGFSQQLKVVVPEAAGLLDLIDVQTAQSLADTMQKAVK